MRRAPVWAWIPVLATVAVQIPYPLVGNTGRSALAVASVLLFFAASTAHALTTRGPLWTAGFLSVAVGGGLAVEMLGVHTGVPFGRYDYAGSLGPRLGGVAVVVPLAWAMMAYPTYVLVRRHRRAPVRAAVLGGLVLATWDLFLDPQMVTAGHWQWLGGGPALNGIPLTNFLGWLLVGTVMAAVLLALPDPTHRLPRSRRDERIPLTLLAWTYLSCVLANLVFFGEPGVAVTGGIAMGAVLAVALRPWRTDRRADDPGRWGWR
ncbi:carotenoid biosynthesis protein [Frankia sp. AiPs1]|uniref:bisanhydrobacterioruberin hydratase CruF n=1 Tax=Frankia sp. AiPs1 TaxID=573493 RepID=UPI0020436E57|nr:bisanhydrobacterioruberin hydratase CruF [Frankia sp. AiPs1]MCM3925820.1 carotenoid biosynthesis protein [Frankia sp. AiPs1]